MTLPALPLRPIELDVVQTLKTAVAHRPLTQEIAAAAAQRGVHTVLFLGVGGSWASSVPATMLLTAQAKPLAVYNVNAGEFPLTHLGSVDSGTLVVASSHSGGTPETVAAAQDAAAAGAIVVSVAKDTDNPLSAAAAYNLAYGSEHTVTSAKYTLLEELSYSLFEAFGIDADITGVRSALDRMPEAAVHAAEAHEDRTREAVARLYNADNIYVLGTGRLLGLSYMLSVCYLVEMQRQKSTHFNSGDFFHGPFEIIDDNSTSVIHLASADATRPMSDRVNRFLGRYGRNHLTVDAAALDLPGVPDKHRAQVAHIAMAEVTARIAYHFEPLTGHNLDIRRYMYKVEY